MCLIEGKALLEGGLRSEGRHDVNRKRGMHKLLDARRPYKFIGFGAIDVTKPSKFIGFGAIDVTKTYKLIVAPDTS